MTIRLEVGKRYLNRQKQICTVTGEREDNGEFFYTVGDKKFQVAKDGYCINEKDGTLPSGKRFSTMSDLISEYREVE